MLGSAGSQNSSQAEILIESVPKCNERPLPLLTEQCGIPEGIQRQEYTMVPNFKSKV